LRVKSISPLNNRIVHRLNNVVGDRQNGRLPASIVHCVKCALFGSYFDHARL
jgi:hypothetical protein